MSRYLFLISSLFLFSSVSSQFLDVNMLKDLKSAEDSDSIITIQYSPGEMFLDREEWYYYYGDFDPGEFPEGDYMSQSVFSPDGTKIYLTNRMTNMLSIFDWETMEVLANVEVGEWPSCIDATDDYIIVGCQFEDAVYIVSADDYGIVDTVPTGEQPCRLHAGPDGEFAYVACDIDDVCNVIDLNSMAVVQTIEDFPVYLQTISWSTQSARNWAKYSDFMVSPDGDYLITHNGQNEVQVFDINTGLVDQSAAVESPRAVAFSGDHEHIVCVANPMNEAHAYSYSWPDLALETSMVINGYGLSTNDVVVDMEGDKAYIGTNNNTSTLVRFYNGDFLTFSNTYTAFWLGVTHDHEYAIGGQNRFSVLDFENEVITDQYIGLNQSWGCVSPVDYHVFSYDPLLYEGVYFFDISNPEDIDYRGTRLSGDEPEGDVPYRVAISEPWIITVNNLSYTCTIFNLYEEQIVAVIDLGEACYDVVVVGGYAVCGGYNNNTVKIIDLSDQALVAEVTTGQRPMELEAHPWDNIVYAGNIKSNSISVIEIDGVNSQVVATIPCGVIGVYIPFFGIRSGVEVSPFGEYLLVAASFDDEVKVIDTETNTIVKSLSVGDFPLSIAYNWDGTIACVTNLFDHTYSILSLDGANSEVVGTFSANGDYPVYVDYCSEDDEFWLCNYNSENVVKVDAQTGDYKSQQSFAAYGGVWNLRFHQSGAPVYLTVGNDNYGPSIIFNDSIFELPAAASHMELGHIFPSDFAVATIPGPDFISVVHLYLYAGMNIPLERGIHNVMITPNPVRNFMHLEADENLQEVRVTDVQGKIVFMEETDTEALVVDCSNWPAGTYFVRCVTRSGFYSSKTVIRE